MMDAGADLGYLDTAPMHYFLAADLSSDLLQQASDYRAHSDNDGLYDPAFAAFQRRFQYDPTQFVAQPISRTSSKSNSPRTTQPVNKRPSIPQFEPSSLTSPLEEDVDETVADNDPQHTARSSSEEKDNLTPQQNKRKAQNRAAQRAFRERKERHVKDLEARNSTLQREATVLQNENDKLKRELARVNAENQILQAKASSIVNDPISFLSDSNDLVAELLNHEPHRDCGGISNMKAQLGDTSDWMAGVRWTQSKIQLTTPPADGSEEPLLDPGATWDYIQAHELVKKGLADIGNICEKLKRAARCDGTGAVFQEKEVTAAIHGSTDAGEEDKLVGRRIDI